MKNAAKQQTDVYSKLVDYINQELFNGELPECMYVFSRNKNIIGGYFSPDKWQNDNGDYIPEIAINANIMVNQDIPLLLNVLMHEMTHFWQEKFGKPSRNGYHNKEWAKKSKEIGLQPDNGNGGETGQSISTEYISGGKAEKVAADLLLKGDEYIFPWFADSLMVDSDSEPRPQTESEKQGKPSETDEVEKPKSGSRKRYVCLTCGAKVWGKFGLSIICGDCNKSMV